MQRFGEILYNMDTSCLDFLKNLVIFRKCFAFTLDITQRSVERTLAIKVSPPTGVLLLVKHVGSARRDKGGRYAWDCIAKSAQIRAFAKA